MRKEFLILTLLLVAGLLTADRAFTQLESAEAASPTPTPATLNPAATITPAPIDALVSPTPATQPGGGSPVPDITPVPAITPPPEKANEPSAVTTSSSFEFVEEGAPVYTLDKAIITAIRQNPDVLRALQEIQRAKGVVIQVRAQALPQINASAELTHTSSELTNRGGGVNTGAGSTPSPTPPIVIARVVDAPPSQLRDIPPETRAVTVAAAKRPVTLTDTEYNIRIIGQQMIFNYSTIRAIRGTFFQRDAAYFSFRNVLDQIIATVKTQFYNVLVNRALITVQEESVNLLESQLKDQQNRFEAGTVPRFNVLQAQVQLLNQIPNLIAARNNYRISILQLAKNLGIDFNPARGLKSPIRVVGDLVYNPYAIDLIRDIEYGKENRPFMKQARANVLNQIEQVHVALGGFFPNFNTSGGYEVLSSPLTTNWNAVSQGWVFGLTGSWNVWDSGATYGLVKQERALLSEAKISYDDDSRQVELEIQTAASNLLQNRETIVSTEKNVELAEEAVRLAKARLDAGAGTQLDVLNAQVQLTTAQSQRLQALFGWQSSLAEYQRAIGLQTTFTEEFDDLAPRAAHRGTYYTGSDVNATGDPKSNVLRPGAVTNTTTRTTRTTRYPSGK